MNTKSDKENMKSKEYNQYYYEKTLEDTNSRYENYEHIIDKFENWLMKLSAGSFGLSFVFIDHFVNFDNTKCLFFLKISWLSFALCLIFSLIDYLVTASGRLKTIKNIWIEYENEVEGENKKELKNNSDTFDTILTALNLILFSSGIICLVIFVFKNIS